jgi:hypothetical protein
MNIGIYKWTSPTGRIYVGQTTDLKSRHNWYFSDAVYKSKMTKLKRSFKKYGVENHIFEIIEYCLLEQLNEKEIYWGLYYNTLEKGLNCKLGEQNCVFSESTKYKMSEAKKGIKQTEEQKQKRKISTKETWKKKMDNGYIRPYCKKTEETRKKISDRGKGKVVSEETKQKISQSLKNKPKSESHKQNMSQSKKGKSIHTEESKQKIREHGKNRNLTEMWKIASEARSKPILQYDSQNNFIKEWNSSNEAELFYNNKKGDNIGHTIRHFKKTGVQRKAYGFIWKSKE